MPGRFVAAALALQGLLQDGASVPIRCAEIMSEEHKADLSLVEE